jgi:hypothetical protein
MEITKTNENWKALRSVHAFSSRLLAFRTNLYWTQSPEGIVIFVPHRSVASSYNTPSSVLPVSPPPKHILSLPQWTTHSHFSTFRSQYFYIQFRHLGITTWTCLITFCLYHPIFSCTFHWLWTSLICVTWRYRAVRLHLLLAFVFPTWAVVNTGCANVTHWLWFVTVRDRVPWLKLFVCQHDKASARRLLTN